jgi:3'(2'), 5'-bisphosphate nucleotidase
MSAIDRAAELGPAELRRLLDPVRLAALAASAAILEIYGTDFTARAKGDASPVTEADERAEAIILAALAALTPDIPVVAEEHAAAHGLTAEAPPRFWLVDPLDGTREFLNRNGEFTVNIALVERDRSVLGVVHVPVLGVTYAACGPGTATRQQGAERAQPIAARPAPSAGSVVVHSRSHGDESELAAFVATMPQATRRVSGSSVKFCLLAAGEADLYPRFGTTMEWDTAAGQAVLEAAGGRVETLDGDCLRYGKHGFRNPHFIARGGPLEPA